MHLGLYGGFPSGDFQGGAFRAFADEPISTGVVSISFQGYFPETSDNSDAAVNFMVAGSNPEGTTSQLYFEPGNAFAGQRSEEHTSELQSRGHLVCRLL